MNNTKDYAATTGFEPVTQWTDNLDQAMVKKIDFTLIVIIYKS